MSYLIERDKEKRRIYRGILSSKETEQADLLLAFLIEEIPKLEQELNEKYGKSVLYKYFLGKKLNNCLLEYNVQERERRYFWDEIKQFASLDERKRSEGKSSNTRRFFEQCSVLAKYDQETIEKLSWRQWQDLLDRVANREDKRIFEWIRYHQGKIKETEWRHFEKALHLMLQKKDTSVFDKVELFELYEDVLFMVQNWLKQFKIFSKTNLKSAKVQNKAKWEKKYYLLCYAKKKKQHQSLTKVCNVAFKELFV